jgi:hypothetical protein
MHQLMLASSLDADDALLANLSRCAVRKLAKDRRMDRLRLRYRLSFDCRTQSLHRLFNFRQLWHFSCRGLYPDYGELPG